MFNKQDKNYCFVLLKQTPCFSDPCMSNSTCVVNNQENDYHCSTCPPFYIFKIAVKVSPSPPLPSPLTEVTYNAQFPYGSDGYRTDCNNIPVSLLADVNNHTIDIPFCEMLIYGTLLHYHAIEYSSFVKCFRKKSIKVHVITPKSIVVSSPQDFRESEKNVVLRT